MVRLVFRPIPKFDDRFARQNRCEPPPEFPLASPYSGIVHHLSGPTATLTSGSVDGAPHEGLPPPFAFTARTGLTPEHSRRYGSFTTITPASEPKRVPRHPEGDTFRGPLTGRPNRRWPAHGKYTGTNAG
ncbi:hypothetical protein P174DRAFT_465297 [Aspergillus novofumigatus IBT 16806]|uniref:Uncharacterized protein n=1 Tax=Aspergillus novofumigatus (strain IBT 16806) TaxID=1392255 RepID=A0A2I1BS79_ASPN1|nr:hypothetical protein P174DRAFT_465297 [Aspergillus novofumigatus IBT 16806]